MKDKPGHGDGHYKGDCDVADEIDIQQTYDGTGSGPVDLPHGYLLGTATDDEGHEDNQTEVCHDKAQQGEYQHQIPGVEFIAVHGAVNVAKRYEIALPVRKHHAAGDLAIFLAFGILPAFGTEYATTGSLSPDMLWPAIPVSLITVAILHANNTRDTATDIRSHIRTIPIAFGPRTARMIYYIEILLPFLWTAFCAVAGLMPWWSLISLIALIPASKALRVMAGSRTAGLETVRALDAMTAQLQTVFSLLVAASFLLSALL